MGTRTVVYFESMPEVGVYLHWGDLDAAKEIVKRTKEYARSPGEHPTYSFARFCEQAIIESGSGISTGIGIGPIDVLDDTYLVSIGDNWEVNVK